MLVIGERINTSRGELLQAVANKDAHAIQSEAVRQRDAGADILDVNCGSLPTHEEPEALRWLVKAVQEASSLELCIDSPNPDALAAGLAVHQGKPLINSISGESDRYTGVLPLAKEYGASVIALGINDDGIPQDESQALEIGKHLVDRLTSDGIPLDDIYFDPLVRSLGTSPEAALETLRLVEELAESFPGLHFVSGLSNISFGLPERRHINRAFAVLSVVRGMDALILDPLDQTVMALIYAAEALSGKDRFSLRYIQAFKEGKLSA